MAGDALPHVLGAALILMLGGCVATLPAPSKLSVAVPCVGEDVCLAAGQRRLRYYRDTKLGLIRHANGGYRLPSAPAALVYPRRTPYAALLIHGLYDSAYYMADLGAVLHARGLNVVTILLPGHGTDPDDLARVRTEDWRAEVTIGWEMARLVGERVIVVGFSLGGALALDLALNGADVHGLMLFAPALDLREIPALELASTACLPGFRDMTVDMEIPLNPVKYRHHSGNGICQLYRLMQDLRERSAQDASEGLSATESFQHLGSRLHVPTFLALSYADSKLSPAPILEMAGAIRAPVTVATFGAPDSEETRALEDAVRVIRVATEGVPHANLVRRTNPYNGQWNPYFDRLERIVNDFARENFAVTR